MALTNAEKQRAFRERKKRRQEAQENILRQIAAIEQDLQIEQAPQFWRQSFEELNRLRRQITASERNGGALNG